MGNQLSPDCRENFEKIDGVTILSGDDALCRASRSAVLRPDRMPMSDDLDVYEELKDITLTVEL